MIPTYIQEHLIAGRMTGYKQTDVRAKNVPLL